MDQKQLSSNPTMQEVYDHVLLSLREQGCASVGEEGHGCLMRGHGRTKCAVGHCISDSIYKEWMNHGGITVMVCHPDLPAELAWMKQADMENLLRDLQMTHDNFMPRIKDSTISLWEAEMKALAVDYSLVYTEPTEK